MVEAYPLWWPEGWKRTERYRRQSSRFKTGFAVSRDLLLDEIRRLGGRQVVLSTNIPLRNDGLPYASAKEPEDSGVAVYFQYKNKPMCFACDRYIYTKENIHAVAKTIEALRGIERWGASDMMERAFTGFMALPEKASQPWREILGSIPVTLDAIESRFRELAKQHHSDIPGGNDEKMRELLSARDAAKLELRKP
jgi:hypothetical protein